MKKPELNKKGATLESFITGNKDLLAGLAVFSALIAFSKGISPELLSFGLSFFLIGGFVLIAFELWYKMPPQLAWRLFLFRYVLLWSIGLVIFYWLFEYRIVWDMFLFLPATALIYAMTSNSIVPVLEKINWTRNFFGIGKEDKTKLQKIIRGLAISSNSIYSFIMGVYLSFGINSILDIIKNIRTY